MKVANRKLKNKIPAWVYSNRRPEPQSKGKLLHGSKLARCTPQQPRLRLAPLFSMCIFYRRASR